MRLFNFASDESRQFSDDQSDALDVRKTYIMINENCN